MEYVKYVGNGKFSSNENTRKTFDTMGLMAKFKVVSGTLQILGVDYSKNSLETKYNIETGETFEFVGSVIYSGAATVEYLHYDRI